MYLYKCGKLSYNRVITVHPQGKDAQLEYSVQVTSFDLKK